MAEPSTFIKLDRNILEWRWFKDNNTYKLFTYFLIKANVTDQPWQDIIIKRGQFVTSFANMSKETGMTIKEVRTSLEKLKRTQEAAQSSTPQYTVVTVLNYNKYQSGAQLGANKGHTKGKQRANEGQQYKNDKNVKNEKNIGGGGSATLDEWRPPAPGTPEYDAWRNQ